MPTLILIRHGQSQWNLENRFTGWWDVDVTEKGAAEAWAAGALMKEKGIAPDTAFTSVQTRAIKTLNLALEALRQATHVLSTVPPVGDNDVDPVLRAHAQQLSEHADAYRWVGYISSTSGEGQGQAACGGWQAGQGWEQCR